MRFVYLDESGIGNPGKEPWVVVGAVMVHANYQLKNVEKYLHDMADDYIKPQHRARFFFHAADLANGSGIFADRELYPHDLVRSLLRGICEIPKLFRLPAIVGHVNREEMRQNYPGLNRQELVVRAQVTASMVCSMAVERYMRESKNTDEVACLIYENNDHARKTISLVHQAFKDPAYLKNYIHNEVSYAQLYLPFERIVEGAFFSANNESSLLQLADAIAFTTNRKLRSGKDCDYFFEPLAPQLVTWPNEFGPRPTFTVEAGGP